MTAVQKPPKRGLEQVGLNEPAKEKEDGEANPPPNKTSSFELNVRLNNIWAFDADLGEYVDRLIQNVSPTQTVLESILDKNTVLTNIKTENLLDPYLRKLKVKQNKRIPLSQDKLLLNLQEKIASVCGPLC